MSDLQGPPLQASGLVGRASPGRCPGLGGKCAFSASRTVPDGGEPSPQAKNRWRRRMIIPAPDAPTAQSLISPGQRPGCVRQFSFKPWRGGPLCAPETHQPDISIRQVSFIGGNPVAVEDPSVFVLVGRSDRVDRPFRARDLWAGQSPGRCPGLGSERAFSALGPIFLGRSGSAVSPPSSVASSGSIHFIELNRCTI